MFSEINKYRFRIQTDGENSLDHTLDHRTLRKRYIYYGQKNSNFIPKTHQRTLDYTDNLYIDEV